jgi:hypothetical protein
MRDSKTMSALAVLLVGLSAWGADPVPDSPIILPVIEVPKTDPPKLPEAGSPIILEPGSIYVFQARVPVHVLLSTNPGGVVKVTPNEGPLKIKNRFADKPTVYESRVFREKFVYEVEAMKGPDGAVIGGTEEIIIVPIGEVDVKKIVRLIFQVGPRPPPDEIKPKPKPDVLTEFEKQVSEAVKLETDRSLLPGLARTYQAGVAASATANTWGTLFLAMSEVAAREKVSGTLPIVQTVIERELAKHLPTTGASNIVLTVADRAKAKKVFTEVAEAIEKAAKQP